ncbi:MAG: hypothetical protein QM426_09445 [Euryarchaeota archaeon]|nr:hypothetical protein [Euryarchaeota archaeon]
MRIVLRENFTSDVSAILVNDLENACHFFETGTQPGKKPYPSEKYMARVC